MKEFNMLKSKIEQIFNSLDVQFSVLELNDEDLNYTIQISTIGKLKPLNSVTCMFYLCKADMSSNLIVGNIYRIQNDNVLLTIYEKINSINRSIVAGNFLIADETPKQIFYKSSMNCGYEFSDLDNELIKFQLNAFISALEMLLNKLKDKTLQKYYEKNK